ncbi:MAG TPA: folylpolyglutamate synthase/dihydrofolate synthase family protein [Vicinamibacterales bacterium]|nr:folylpolyglutamate synthase/dihydrofolate synthase family protein [Vicinamibacterales bacterium]
MSDPLDFLLSLERLGMKFGLENIATLCAALEHPERTFTSIVIAGTNGKGSVTVMVETALRAAGHRTARYTSPHLVRLEERFVIDGREVETGVLRDVVGSIQGLIDFLMKTGKLQTLPTFFECTTAAAFELFRRTGVKIAVLEVGLGGRLDATNVVTPVATAITSIDFDHQAQLGTTLESIAREKAGIAKPGVPMVCGRVPEAAARVIREVCASEHAPLIRASDVVRIAPHDDGETLDVRVGTRSLDAIRLSLPGRHQRENAAVAVAVLNEVSERDIPVPDAAIRSGLTEAHWPARLERFVRDSVPILLDAAHNPAGARALASHLQDIGWSRVTLLFGAMHDKDVDGMLAAVAHACERIICTTAPSPRAMAADELAGIAARYAPTIEVVPDMKDALARAIAYRAPVVAAGSIFLIGPLRDILR